MSRRRYTQELLNQFLERDGADLIGDYDRFHAHVRISFMCKCGRQYSSVFQQIVDVSGAKCISCQTSTLRYDITLLNKSIEESHAVLTGVYDHVNRDTQVSFICECGKQHSKSFRCIVENSKAICDQCSTTIMVNKTKITNQEKYGGNAPACSSVIREKIKNTNQIKYGGASPQSSSEVRDKMKRTCLDRYGVEHPNQNPEILAKAQQRSWKEFTMPSGEVRKVQGYEPYAIRDLLAMGIPEEHIKTDRKDVPRIEYEVDGSKKYHFPDIYISVPDDKKIIEVKSTWTYECKTDNIQLKKKAAEEQGFVYDIWCYDKKGERISV